MASKQAGRRGNSGLGALGWVFQDKPCETHFTYFCRTEMPLVSPAHKNLLSNILNNAIDVK